MKNNKLITFVLALLVCFSLVLTASATSDNTNLTLAVEANPSTVVYGNTIKVSVKANENPGFLCVNFQIMWDTSVLEFVSADTTGSAFTEVEANYQQKFNKVVITVGDPYIALNRPTSATKFNGTGTIVDLTFKVKEGANADMKANVYFTNPSFVTLEGLSSEALTTKDLPVVVLSSSHVHKSAKPATCTEPEVCELCGTQMAPAVGHKPGAAATCTTPQVCTVCNTELASAGSHNLVLKSNATYHWKACTRCDYTTGRDAHIFWDSVCNTCGYGCEHTGGTATCTERAMCTKCYMRYGTTAPHTPGSAATCTEPQKCTACGNVLVEALKHDIVNHEAKAATCTEAGHNAYETCTRCDYTTYQEIAALNHDIQTHAAKAATCTEAGYNAYETCSRCDYTTFKEIPANNHALVDHAAKAPTCTEDGYNAYQTCKNCSYTTYKVQHATGHTLENHEAKAPTCTEKGNNAYQTCKNCDYTTFEEIPATGTHTYGEWEIVKEPTHKETGENKRVCSVCGDVDTEVTPVLEGMPTWQIILIVVGVAAVIAVVVIIVIKKKKA